MSEDLALAERVRQHLAAALPEQPKPAPECRQPLPVFRHSRFRCPACGSSEFDSNRMRSRRKPDGKSRQVKTCAECRFVFVLKVE